MLSFIWKKATGGRMPGARPAAALEHLHTAEAIRERMAGSGGHGFLRDWIFGGIDGAVTTFAVVSGAAGAALQPGVVLILGIANLLADGLSMGASNYLGTSAERDEIARAEAIERRHIDTVPAGERDELREIFRRKGLHGETLEAVVEQITSSRRQWVSTMLAEEYGLPRTVRNPVLAGLSTFSAFIVCGLVPLIPYLLWRPDAFVIASVLTGIVFFAIGSVKGAWSTRPWWRSAFETLVVGAAAASAAYLAGTVLQGLA